MHRSLSLTLMVALAACTTREPAGSEPMPEPAERTQRVQLELARVPDALAAPVIAELGLTATGLIAARHHIDPGWHIYWRNPGSAGLPTTLTSTPGEGSTLELGAPLLPAPDRFEDAFGWADEAIVFVPILAGEGGSTVRSKWVACMSDACVAGESEASLAPSEAADDAMLRAMLNRIPRPLGDRLLSSAWMKADDRVKLSLTPAADVRTIEFFPDATDPALFFVEADYVREDDTLTIVWRPGGSGYPPSTGQGVMAWTDDTGTRYYELDLPWPD